MSILSMRHGASVAARAGTTSSGSRDLEQGGRDDPGQPAEADFSHLFRSEGLVSDVDLRVDVAKNYSRYVAGDEEVSVRTSLHGAGASMAFVRGSRNRTAGSFEQVTDNDVMMNVVNSVEETVEGGVHLKANFSAEGMVGGAYVNTIAGVYLRLAAWVDFLAWGGWSDVDAIRCELSLLMIRSHFLYAHAAGVRVTMAARLIDDFQIRSLHHGAFTISGATYLEAGDPAGGIHNEA